MTIKTWSYISYIFEKHNIYDSRQGSRFFVVFAIILQKSKRLISNSSKHFETGLVNEVISFFENVFVSQFFRLTWYICQHLKLMVPYLKNWKERNKKCVKKKLHHWPAFRWIIYFWIQIYWPDQQTDLQTDKRQSSAT